MSCVIVVSYVVSVTHWPMLFGGIDFVGWETAHSCVKNKIKKLAPYTFFIGCCGQSRWDWDVLVF